MSNFRLCSYNVPSGSSAPSLTTSAKREFWVGKTLEAFQFSSGFLPKKILENEVGDFSIFGSKSPRVQVVILKGIFLFLIFDLGSSAKSLTKEAEGLASAKREFHFYLIFWFW